MSEIKGTYDIHDPAVVAVIDDLPLWSAPFGLKLLDVVRLGRGLTVLDVGSGAGFPVVELSQRLGASCRVFGVDPWPEAVARAREKVRTWGITNLQIVDGTAEKLPFDEATFDLVVSNNGTNNVDDEERAFAEIVRVAKPGAQVAFTVNLPDTMVEFYAAYRGVLRRRGLEDAIARVDRHIAEKRKPLEHHLRLVERAGLEVVGVHEDSFAFRYTDGAAMLDHFTIKLAFIGGWTGALEGGDVEAVFEEVRAELDGQAAREGELRLTIPWVCLDCRKPARPE